MGKLKSITLFDHICGWYLLLCTLLYYSAVYDGFEIIGYLCFYIIPFIYILIHYRDALFLLRICLKNRLKYYIAAIFFMGVISLLLPIMYHTNDFTYFSVRILQLAKESVKLLFLVMVFIRYISPDGDLKLFMRYFVLATCIYVLGTMLIISIPPLRELLLTLNKADANTVRLAHKATYWTRFGWCGFSGFTYTLKCSLSVMMMCYLMYEERFVRFWENCALLFLCMLGNLFYGRVGMIVSGIFFVILTIAFWKVERILAYRLLGMIGCGIVLILSAAICSSKARSWLYWAFQSIVNLVLTGSMETTSSASLEKMYFMPNWKTIFIGDARYMTKRGFYYMGTDVGVMRALLFGGIFFQALRYSTLFVTLKQLKDDNAFSPARIVYASLILFVIFELKGEVIAPIISIIFASALLAAYAKNREKE